MKIEFSVSNPEHRSDYRDLTMKQFTDRYTESFRVIQKRFPYLEHINNRRESKKEDYNPDNPEHLAFFNSHQWYQIMKKFSPSSLIGIRKWFRTYNTKKTRSQMEEYKAEKKWVIHERTANYSDMRPAHLDIIGKIFYTHKYENR